MKHIVGIAAALLLAEVALAHPEANQSANTAKVGAVAPSARPAAAVVDAFHAALRRGDTKAALSHLAENALIYEAGGVERGRQEYASHHLGADSAFAQAVPGQVTRRAGQAVGNIAWIATEGRTTGTYKGKAVDRVTTETMVLRRVGRAWKIAHIHWSSGAGAK
ncbi:MAG: nuclear transport factor 2 family protein [Pseudomonadota bacterium]|nr:nuclear transport factor 2 family protein [Pseudomonadota bacterium]